jgi:hypothetical protein
MDISDKLYENGRLDMKKYDDLSSTLRNAGLIENFELVDAKKLQVLRARHPGIPEDYLEFLTEVGWGTFGEVYFSVYSGPIDAEDVYDPETAARFKTLLILGDDCAGCNIAFDTMRSWAIVEIESATMEVDLVAKTFEEFIRSKASYLIEIRLEGSE